MKFSSIENLMRSIENNTIIRYCPTHLDGESVLSFLTKDGQFVVEMDSEDAAHICNMLKQGKTEIALDDLDDMCS